MSGKLLLTTVFFFLLVMVSTQVAPASAEEGNCKENKMYVSNQVTVNLWYKRDGDDCSLLNKHNIFMISPGEVIQIYSDSTCKTEYCSSLKHDDFRSFDRDGDCRVRILTGCLLSDM
jgi:hypothetical protein